MVRAGKLPPFVQPLSYASVRADSIRPYRAYAFILVLPESGVAVSPKKGGCTMGAAAGMGQVILLALLQQAL